MTKRDQERPLNDNQQRRLRVTCEHVDHVLSEMENALNESASKAAFPTYISDMTAEQQHSVDEYITVVRERLMQMLEIQDPPILPAFPCPGRSSSVSIRLISLPRRSAPAICGATVRFLQPLQQN